MKNRIFAVSIGVVVDTQAKIELFLHGLIELFEVSMVFGRVIVRGCFYVSKIGTPLQASTEHKMIIGMEEISMMMNDSLRNLFYMSGKITILFGFFLQQHA